jgi:N-acetylglutamate synthase-like GNAT family acetyltransferase
MPITFVAVDVDGAALGAVGLAEFDLEERRDRSPWVIGTIVRADHRNEGVGRVLLAALEELAIRAGLTQLWVATERAASFYESCGFHIVERLARPKMLSTDILTKNLHTFSDSCNRSRIA